ncbi:MAG TPA: hypothetical protein VMU38_01180 [Candidatus Binatia bacterium]|nr:hypothetical protein [Candidatus Binatia bacterium]
MKLLCLDAGSSSLKFAVYRAARDGTPARLTSGSFPATADAESALDRILESLDGEAGAPFAAIGHRIVFGGPRYQRPVLADDAVVRELEGLVGIEPLHLRAELDLLAAVRRRFPGAASVLAFDTAFHARAPAIAKRLPLPGDLDPLLMRYGFHGLSYEYVVSQLGDDRGRTVVAHLGSGASLCALRDGAPVDTTMGFSALGGLMMATRPGDLDPGAILRLLDDGYDATRLTDLLYRRSGLLGVSGRTAEMRELLETQAADPAARDAVELFVYQLVKHLGSMVAVLGGLDRLVFTGGIGERAPAIRNAVASAFQFLGVRLDDEANRASERTVSCPESAVRVLVVPTDENLVIARHAIALVSAS